jgi:hypothetical protein
MLYDDRNNPVDYVYLNVNGAFRRLMGVAHAVDKQATEVFPGIGELHPELFEKYGRVASTGKPEDFEIDFKPIGKMLHISAFSPESGYFFAVFNEIASLKNAGQPDILPGGVPPYKKVGAP